MEESSLLGMRGRDVDDGHGRGLRTRVDRCSGGDEKEDGGDMELLHRHGCHSP